jgi:hypothetical protein
MVKQILKNQIENIKYREKKIFWILFSVFMFFIVSYGFLLNGAIMNAVSKQSLEKQIIFLESDVNTLESNYLSLKDGITLSLALSKGFVSISSNKFATINSAQKSQSLSINEN